MTGCINKQLILFHLTGGHNIQLVINLTEIDVICAPVRLNETLCVKLDFWVTGKNMSKGQIFPFFFLNINTIMTNTFLMKMWKKRCVMEHFILDWSIEVYITIFDSPNLCNAVLDDILHFWWEYHRVIIFASKCVKNSVYCNGVLFSILIRF